MHARCSEEGGEVVDAGGQGGMESEADIHTYLDAERCDIPGASVSTTFGSDIHSRGRLTGNRNVYKF